MFIDPSPKRQDFSCQILGVSSVKMMVDTYISRYIYIYICIQSGADLGSLWLSSALTKDFFVPSFCSFRSSSQEGRFSCQPWGAIARLPSPSGRVNTPVWTIYWRGMPWGSRRIWLEGSSRTSLNISSRILVLVNHECVIMRATFTIMQYLCSSSEYLSKTILTRRTWRILNL